MKKKKQRRCSQGFKGKLEGLAPGTSIIAYRTSSEKNEMAVGMFRGTLEELGQVEIHAYGALRSMRLVLQWKPLYMSAEGGYIFAREEGDTG